VSEQRQAKRERDEQPREDKAAAADEAGEKAKGSVEQAEERGEEVDEAKRKIQELEEGDPPEKLEDWPDDQAKYETFGGPEGDHSYDEGPEKKLGPSSLRHHEGGEVTIAGEEVEDPDEYKGEPIPGGPTDPNAPGEEGGEKGSDEG
jgi:hypothetical protein